MEKFYIALNGYGDSGEYTEELMVGNTNPSTVFKTFTHNKITDKTKDYISAYRYEEEVLRKLVLHFQTNPSNKLKVKTYSVGD